MGFPPKIGEAVFREHATKGAEVLGEIKAKAPGYTAWTDAETQARIEMESGPPPWELEGTANPSDARNFVDVPSDWVLYWINPKLLEADGWRGYMPVSPSDSRVTLKVASMRSPDNLVRRGHQGDILGYMPREWYESRKRQTQQRTQDQTQASVDRVAQLKDEFRGGKYPGFTLEKAVHPTHTMADPQEMRQRGDA